MRSAIWARNTAVLAGLRLLWKNRSKSARVGSGVVEPVGEFGGQPSPFEQLPGRHPDQLVGVVGAVGGEHDRGDLGRSRASSSFPLTASP